MYVCIIASGLEQSFNIITKVKIIDVALSTLIWAWTHHS